MTKPNKPREWWMQADPSSTKDSVWVGFAAGPNNPCNIHVIEYSAYQQLKDENEKLKFKYDELRKMADDRIAKIKHEWNAEVEAYIADEEKLMAEIERHRTGLAKAANLISKHIELHCPKSHNQSACTWMHHYDGLKEALKSLDRIDCGDEEK